MKTIVLLVLSNTFMNLAWYGHLKFKDQPSWLVILAIWASRSSSTSFRFLPTASVQWSGPSRSSRECITLVVFTMVAYALFGSTIKWNYLVSYAFVAGAVFFVFGFSSMERTANLPSRRSLKALDCLNIFLADVRDGVGPFLAIYLSSTQHWDAAKIGLAMSVCTIATVVVQSPAGWVDQLRQKQALVVIASVLVSASALP